MQPDVTRFIPVERWVSSGHLFPANEHELRYLLRNREKNGLNSAVLRVGRRLLIDEQAFIKWIESHREAPAAR